MANRLLLYTPSSRMSAFFAVLLCCWTCSASSDLIASAPMAMNVSLNSVVSVSCSSSDMNASITLLVTGVMLDQNEAVVNGLNTATALFIATADRNGTMMRCSVSSGSQAEGSAPVKLLIQGPPSNASDPDPQPIDACSMKITWSPPFTLDGVPLFYNLTVTITSTQEIVDHASTEDAEYILSPRDLTETYTVRIKAWNAAGSSDEVDLNVKFTTEDFVAVLTDFRRDGVTWMLDFTALNICMSQAIANATIELCPESGEQQCYPFLAPKEDIEQIVDGELRLSFPVHVQDQGMYESTLYVYYESGQEMYSQSSFQIDTSDISDINVSSDSNGMACFSVTQIPGSLLYGMVVNFVATESGNSITRVVVVNDDESVCIDDLPPGHYDISVGELDAPLLPVDELTIEGGSTSITTIPSTSTSGMNAEDQSVIVVAILVPIIMILLLLLLLVIGITLFTCLKFYHKKDEQHSCLRVASIHTHNRISVSLQDDKSDHFDSDQGQERCVESDAIQLKSVVLTDPDPAEKVRAPIQVSERERSPQIYKPSV